MKYILSLLLLFSILLSSEEYYPELGRNNFGNEFLISIPPNLQPINNKITTNIKFVLYSPVKGEINISIPGKGYDQLVQVDAYSPRSVSIDSRIAQVLSGDGYQKKVDNFVMQNSAIQFKSDIMFSVVVLSDFPESADAFLALPVSSMSKKYVVSSWADFSEGDAFTFLPSSTVITSAEDNNIVTIRYASVIDNDNNQGRIFSYQKKLDKGDVWYLSSELDLEDISGSVITSTKLISVVSGNQCAEIPRGNVYCDFIVGQDIPVDFWGYEYLITGYLNRKKNPMVRVFSYQDSTIIFKNDEPIDTLIFKDEFNSFSSFLDLPRSNKQESYIIKGDKPILCVQYGTGAEEDFEYEPLGNPFMMHLPSLDKLEKQVYISNPDAEFDISFPGKNYLNIIYELDDDLSLESLEIGEVLNNSTNWVQVEKFNGFRSAELLNTNSKNYAIIKIDLGTPGNFRIRGKNGLNASLYGNNDIKSYGYPASYPTTITNLIDSIPPSISWKNDCGLIQLNVTDTQEMDIVHLVEDNVNFEVIDNQKISKNEVELLLKVIDPSNEAYLKVTFFDKARNRSTEEIYYYPNNVSFEPEAIDFGKIRRGEEFIEALTITNNTDSVFVFESVNTNNLPIEIALKNSVDPINGELQIPAFGKLELDVKFRSYYDSIYVGHISFFNYCLGELKVKVEADVSSPVIYVSDIPFQFLTNGDNRSNTFNCKIENTGATDLIIHSYEVINESDIQNLDLPLITASDPLVINSNSEYNFKVTLNTLRLGEVNSSIIFKSNASGIDSICTISGKLVSQGIITRGTDFGRKKVSVSNYEFGPYKSNNSSLIENSSPFPIKIEQIRINKNLNGESFIYEGVPITFYDDLLTAFLDDKTFIEAESKIELDVEFQPQNLDSAYLEIEVLIENSNSFTPAVFELVGFGTRPKLEIEILQPEKYYTGLQIPSEGSIILRNLSQSDWEYADDIDELEMKIDILSPNKRFYNIESATYNIPKGEQITIPFTFETSEVLESGDYPIDIAIYSEAITTQNIFTLNTEVTNQEISYKVIDNKSELIACQGSSDQIQFLIENNGQEEVIFDPIRIEPPLPQFTISDFDFLTSDFSIGPGESDTIEVKFISTGDDREAKIILKPKKQLLADSLQLIGKNFYVEPVAKIIPANIEVKVNQEKINKIKLDQFNDQNLSDISILNVSLIYDSKYLQIDPSKLKLSDDLLSNYIIDNRSVNSDLGLIKFDIVALDSFEFTNNMDLVDFSIFGLLPQDLNNSTKIETKIEIPENSCINFISDESGRVEILTVCDQDYRKVNIFGEYFLQNNLPNPINNNILINYGIALPGQTLIQVYNSNGELILILVDEYLEAGSYSFNLPADLLPNGIYFLTVSSGVWNTTHQFTVAK